MPDIGSWRVDKRRLSTQVTVQQPTTPTDGETVPTWTSVGTDYVEVRPVSGGETFRGRQVEAGVTYILNMRYREDITPRTRLLWGTRQLNIVRVIDPDNSGHYLELQVKEIP